MQRLLIRNISKLVSCDESDTVYENVDLYAEDGVIRAIGPKLEKPAEEVLDAGHMLCYPGLINTHHHLYQQFSRNLPQVQNMELFDWLKTLYEIWKNLDTDVVRLSSLTGMGELMKHGCTTCFDHHYVFPAGAGGLIYLPYLEGERSPVFDAQAQGVFFGMNTTHKREHFLRAVLEGTACGLSQILDVMRERQEIHDLRIIGGGAKSKLWKQILADVCNVTFHDVSTFSDSATSLGAAAAAGVAIGLFRDLPEACSHIRMSGDIEPDPAVQPVYALIKKRYAMLYPSLKEAFHTRA